MPEELPRHLQVERLQELHRVARLHYAVDGLEPVKLNGESRKLDMYHWACDTSACLLGSYCLTELGKQHFEFVDRSDLTTNWWTPYLRHRERAEFGENPMTHGAEHFGITNDEACYLFNPGFYDEHERDLSGIDDPEDPDEVDEAPVLASAVLDRTCKILDKYEVPRTGPR